MILFYIQFSDTNFKIRKNFKFLGDNINIDIVSDSNSFFKKLKELSYDIVFIKDGKDLSEAKNTLENIQKINPLPPVVFIVEEINKTLAEELIHSGAIDVITEKEFFSPTLTNTYFKAIEKNRMKVEEKKLNQIIAKGQKFWLTVFDTITDLAFILDTNGRLVRCNKPFANMFGKHPRELVGKDISEFLVHPLFQNFDTKDIDNNLELNFNGKIFSVTHTRFDFEDQENIVFFLRDITDIKKIREHLFIKDKYTSIGTLASGIAHEINNPLTGIIGFTQMLKMINGCRENSELLDKILECADRCKRIVESLLIYSRQKPATKSLETVNDIVERTIDLIGYNLKKNNIVVEKELQEIPIALLDGQQIQQALINMILNAQDAILLAKREKGLIKIKTEFNQSEKKIYIKISDNGTGISDEVKVRIFDPFFTTKPFGEAMGLGLSIAYGIIKEHNGDIFVETKEGVGTTFVIMLTVEI